jgi:hypothetical protein
MKQIVLMLSLLGLICTVATASPLCVNDDTLQNYMTNYNSFANACQIGDKLFWGFNFSVGASNTPTAGPNAGGIQVQTLPGDGLTNIGISFNTGGWAVSSGVTIDNNITYNVTTFTSQPLIKDLTLTIAGTLTGTSGSATTTETVNPAVPGTPLTASLPGVTSAHTDFLATPVTTLSVTNNIHLVGGVRFSDLAHISVVENDFSELVSIPEPQISFLVGSGLLLLAVGRRKYFHRASLGGQK